ncbi:MAG: ABC transporter substrate-binding protein [Paenibacillus macerans]|nr:ABC transporter substrate-binding protein [Paenibacillus macerans]MDU7472821.1 ABC transporter substrate-binding protein [Paenibacillus macerans]MEC0138885.1 ABC transporter substrate-binding protein [Paenibacillus macerans]MEC0333348.1 ABC transporter substrate-binding protein [Paenibacillus macerans]GIP12734.1 iron-hydroxamate ABC transporter substrate-binding protein [Paenibacillus macerans]
MKTRWFMLAAICLSLSGCQAPGSIPPSDSGEHSPAGAAVVIEDFAGRRITFDRVPQKIVALSGGDLNIAYALGGMIVGRPTVSETSGISEPLPDTLKNAEQIGTTHEIDFEKIAMLAPDAVLGNAALNVQDAAVIENLGSQMVLTSANSIADIKEQIRLFGQMLRQTERAEQLVADLDEQLAAYKAAAEEKDKPKALLVYGAPGTYMAALPNSLGGDILAYAGGANIAGDFPGLDKFPQYAQLNVERIAQANPQYIFIMTHGDAGKVKQGLLKELQQNEAWSGIDAVKHNRVEVLPGDLFGTNPGIRVTESVELLHSLLKGGTS